jgi:hypothetical protein
MTAFERFERQQRREQAITKARARLQEAGEPGDSFPVCTGGCSDYGQFGNPDRCEFCERHVLQHDGSWIVQTLE